MIMMCLWRVAALSRFLLWHMAFLSTLQPKPCTNQPQQQNKSCPNSFFIHAHSTSPHSHTATVSSSRQDNDYFGRNRSNNNSNNIYPSHFVGDRYNYIRHPLGRISLPPISPSSIMQNLLWTVKTSIQRHPKTCRQTHIDTDDDVRTSDNYMMATSSVSVNDEKKVEEAPALSASLPQKSSPSLLLNDDNDDNSDIFYRNDDDYFESSYSSASSVGQKRRRAIWWMMENDLKDNEPEQQEQNQGHISHAHPSFDTVQQVIRIKVQKPSKVNKDKTGSSSKEQQQYIESLTQPLMTESVWNQLTGMEWCTTANDDIEHGNVHDQLLDSLAAMGESVARIDTPTEWIDWQVYSSSSISSNDQKDDLLDKDAVQVWTGKCIATPPQALKSLTDSDDADHQPQEIEEKYLGIQLPFIKARAILPYSVADVVDLLLDSKKVVTYNPWSLGRRDCWIDTSSSSSSSSSTDTITKTIHTSMITKIVQNRVQPPIPGARQVVSTTLLHARPIRSTVAVDEINDSNTTSWIIVSRSVGKNHIYNDESDAKTKTSRSDILLGVNLLEPVRSKDGTILDKNQCRITAVAHVYSPSVPTAFAERLGVQSSIKFIQDIKSLKTKTNNAAATTTAGKTHETAKVPN